jgi:hypothetical protein
MDVSRVIVFTDDVTRLSEFYRTCFGLTFVGEASDEWTELNGGGCSLAFHKIDEHSTTRDGWIKLVFGSTDVLSDKMRLERLGVKMSDVVEFGDIHLCDGRDPDGNWFQISSRGM